MMLTREQYNELEQQGRMTIVLASASMVAAGIDINMAVDSAFRIYDRVIAVEHEREESANKKASR